VPNRPAQGGKKMTKKENYKRKRKKKAQPGPKIRKGSKRRGEEEKEGPN